MIDVSARVNAYKNKSYYIVMDTRTSQKIICRGVKINGNRARFKAVLETPFLNLAVCQRYCKDNNIKIDREYK